MSWPGLLDLLLMISINLAVGRRHFVGFGRERIAGRPEVGRRGWTSSLIRSRGSMNSLTWSRSDPHVASGYLHRRELGLDQQVDERSWDSPRAVWRLQGTVMNLGMEQPPIFSIRHDLRALSQILLKTPLPPPNPPHGGLVGGLAYTGSLGVQCNGMHPVSSISPRKTQGILRFRGIGARKGRRTMARTKIAKTQAPTWGQRMSSFITHLEDTERSAHTVHHYRHDLAAFQKWYLTLGTAGLDLDQITDEVLRQWKRHLREEVLTEKTGRTYKRKPASINAKLAAMRSFLRWASHTGLVKTMPETPRRERIGRHPVKSLDRNQQNRLLREAARSHARRDHALIVILLELGLRVAELVALVWNDIRLTDRKGWFSVREGKGRKPRGPFPMTADAVRAFKVLKELDPTVRSDRPGLS